MNENLPETESDSMNAAESLRPFLRGGEQIVWCLWEPHPTRFTIIRRALALSGFLTAAPLLGLLLGELYRYYTQGEFQYPVYFLFFAIILGTLNTIILVRIESKAMKRLLGLTNRRVIQISFDHIAVQPDQASFDLEELNEYMRWINYAEIDRIKVVEDTGVIIFRGEDSSRVIFSELPSVNGVLSLLPEDVLAKLGKRERRRLETYMKAGKVS